MEDRREAHGSRGQNTVGPEHAEDGRSRGRSMTAEILPSMDKLKKLTDADLIKLLQNYGIKHGPIVESTRTLYEKRLYEFERKKKTGSAESSYESRQQYSTKEYNDNQVHTLKTCTSSGKDNCKGELQAPKSEHKIGAGTSRDISLLDFPRPCCELLQTEINFGKENPADVNQEQKKGARKTRQKKGTRKAGEKKEAMETRQQVHVASPVSVCSASATAVDEVQEVVVKVTPPPTSRPSQAKHSRSPAKRCHEPEPLGDLKMQWQAEEKPSYGLALSLVPLLDKVPEEKMVALRHDLLDLITSYYPNAPPKPTRSSTRVPPRASAQQ